MRVLEGKYRRRPLESLPSPRVRPTARRLREALFDFLGARIAATRFLDLCAGSGAIGIEALSRGAAHVTFVERSARMCSLIKLNLQRCEVPPAQVEILESDAIEFLRPIKERESLAFDVAFFDPPYAADYDPALSFFGGGTMLKRKSSEQLAIASEQWAVGS